MGRSYWYECSKCGYRARVSGRADRGLDFFTQTISCQDCRELFDAVTRMRVPQNQFPGSLGPGTGWRLGGAMLTARALRRPPSFQHVASRLSYKGANRFHWVQFKIQCPASAIHRVQNWNDPGKCPRCGVFLERHALPYRIWD